MNRRGDGDDVPGGGNVPESQRVSPRAERDNPDGPNAPMCVSTAVQSGGVRWTRRFGRWGG